MGAAPFLLGFLVLTRGPCLSGLSPSLCTCVWFLLVCVVVSCRWLRSPISSVWMNGKWNVRIRIIYDCLSVMRRFTHKTRLPKADPAEDQQELIQTLGSYIALATTKRRVRFPNAMAGSGSERANRKSFVKYCTTRMLGADIVWGELI